MKVTLLNDTDGRENIGCRLTSSALKQQLTHALNTESNPLELTPFPWRFSHGDGTGRAWMQGLAWIRTKNRSDRANGFVDWLRQVAECEYGTEAVSTTLASDLVIFHPEGSISDYHDAVRIMNLLSLPLLAHTKQIPVFTLNGTFPLYPRDDRRYRIIQAFLKACAFCALRDRITADYFDTAFMPDSAIMHPVSTAPANSRPYVLITTGANQSKGTNLAMARAALRVCETQGLTPLVMTKKHKDLRAIQAVVIERGGQFIEQASLAEAEQWLRQCALHIGGRYHMALFGLILDVPSVLIPVNTHKNRWLAEEFAGIELVTNPTDIVPVATQLFLDRERAGNMQAAVRQAREQFGQGIKKAAGVAHALIRKDKTGTASDHDEIIDTVSDQLRLRDILSFYPFGIRIRFNALTRKPAWVPASGGSCS